MNFRFPASLLRQATRASSSETASTQQVLTTELLPLSASPCYPVDQATDTWTCCACSVAWDLEVPLSTQSLPPSRRRHRRLRLRLRQSRTSCRECLALGLGDSSLPPPRLFSVVSMVAEGGQCALVSLGHNSCHILVAICTALCHRTRSWAWGWMVLCLQTLRA